MAVKDYSTDPNLNTSINGINIAEGCAPGNINNAIRQVMADTADGVVQYYAQSKTSGEKQIARDNIGLGNVDNTSDANKPVSTATLTALNGKVSNSDSRLTNAREWTASTVNEAEAKAGTATTRRAWTAQRVRQAAAAVAVGGDQAWQDMSGSRAVGTSYQNTTGVPIMVVLDIASSGSQPWTEVSSNNSTWLALAKREGAISFVVPPGWYYRIRSNATIIAWSELR